MRSLSTLLVLAVVGAIVFVVMRSSPAMQHVTKVDDSVEISLYNGSWDQIINREDVVVVCAPCRTPERRVPGYLLPAGPQGM